MPDEQVPDEQPVDAAGVDDGLTSAVPAKSPPVPDASAQRVDDESLGDRVAELAEDAVDTLLTDDELRETEHGVVDEGVAIEAPARPATTKRSGEAVTASPLLIAPRAKHPEAIVLFVHGGDVEGRLHMRRGDPGYLRMVPFARDVERRSKGRVGGALVRLAVRGWNDPEKPAVEDTRWALRELRRRYPNVPIALAGHSMGGRVVLELGDDAMNVHNSSDDVDVAARVLLAPWAADEYDPSAFAGTPLLALHGKHDTVTDPEATEAFVAAVNADGGDARFVSFPGWHAMLLRPNRWHKVTSHFLIDHLAPKR